MSLGMKEYILIGVLIGFCFYPFLFSIINRIRNHSSRGISSGDIIMSLSNEDPYFLNRNLLKSERNR